MTRQARGGKKRRTVANEDDDDDDGQDEMNEQTIFSRERFWEVPLTFETNINLTKDSCLVPADQITLRERDFDEPSQIDDTFDEVCLFLLLFLYLNHVVTAVINPKIDVR